MTARGIADRVAGPGRGGRSALLAAGAAVVLALAGTPAASADPVNNNSFPLDLSCSDGQHYSVTVLETAADRAAVHVLTDTSVLVPTRFQWHIVVTDAEGQVLDESSTPPEPVHGASADRLDTVRCTFTQVAHHDWPDVGPVTIRVDGTVDAFLPQP